MRILDYFEAEDWVDIIAYDVGHEFYCDRQIIERLVKDIR